MNASRSGGLRKSKIEVGLDQVAFSARRGTVLRQMIEKECIRYSKIVILRHIRLSTTGRGG
jgi:hypothetical protein